MATVNLLNSGWTTDKSLSDIVINDTSSYVEFILDGGNTQGYAKACIAIDASKYSTISFNYSSVSRYGNTSLSFGIFDNMTPSDSTGTIILSDKDFNNSSGGSVSKNISLSGTKYVGFRFYVNSSGVGYCKAKPYITSLTATEKVITYTLSYNANGGSGAPSAVSNITSTTISSTIPTRTGYDFLGWSTSSTATSASYVAGNSISLSSNVTLYAVWKKKTYAVTYNANGGSGAPAAQTKTYGTALTLSSTKPTKSSISAGSYKVTLNANGGTCSSSSLSAARTTKYTFSKWNTNSSGTGTSYNAGASYTANAALSLYAIYSSSTTTAAVTLPTPTRSGYNFMGWATSNTATSGTKGSYTPPGNVTLYAIWSAKDYTLSLNGNGGSFPDGSSYTVTYNSGNYCSFAGWNIPTRAGYTFNGLYTAASGGTKIYNSDGSCVNDGVYWKNSVWVYAGDCTLYAQWEVQGLVYIYDSGKFSPYQVLIYDGSGWNQYIPYIYTESGWKMYSG